MPPLDIGNKVGVDQLLGYAQQQGGAIEGRIKPDGGLEVFRGDKASDDVDQNIARAAQDSTILGNGNALGKQALFEALSTSFGSETASKVFDRLQDKIYSGGQRLTADLIANARELARSMSAQPEAPQKRVVVEEQDQPAPQPSQHSNASHPAPVRRSSLPQHGTQVEPKKPKAVRSARANSIGAKLDKAQKGVDAMRDIYSDLRDKTRSNRKSHARRLAELKAKYSDKSQRRRTASDAGPSNAVKPDISVARRRVMSDAESAPPLSIQNRRDGRDHLKQLDEGGEFGILLQLARHPDKEDLLGKATGLPHTGDLSRPQADLAILRAFARHAASVSELSDAEKNNIVIDALRTFIGAEDVPDHDIED